MNRMKVMFLLLIVGGILMACSSGNSTFTAKQMISQALEQSEKPRSYKGEFSLVMKEGEKILEEGYYLEWRDEQGRLRMEAYDAEGEPTLITVNDGEAITMYNLLAEQAMISKDPELMELNFQSPREQAEASLAMIRDSHKLSIEGEEEIAGRQTEHILAIPKEDQSLIGRQEMWLDKETWFVLKTISESADLYVELEYERIEFDLDVDEGLFQLDFPKGVELINLDESIGGDEVTLSEAAAALGQSFLYFPEGDMSIQSIEQSDLEGIVNRTEIDLEYIQDDLPYLTLSIFEAPVEDDDFTFPGEERVTIRGEEAIFIDESGFRSVYWDEGGFRYNILLHAPDLTLEDIQELTEDMTMASESDG